MAGSGEGWRTLLVLFATTAFPPYLGDPGGVIALPSKAAMLGGPYFSATFFLSVYGFFCTFLNLFNLFLLSFLSGLVSSVAGRGC